MTNTNSHFAVKFAERSSHPFFVYLKIQLVQKTSKFDQTLDEIRIEKIISAPIWTFWALIWATKLFFGDFSSTRCQTLSQAAILESCAISKKNNDANLRKWQKPKFRAQLCLPSFFVSFTSTSKKFSQLSFYTI